ncbi:MAG: hypothetical protein K6G70_08675 [Bacteroidaceae bacterium]|nr:hypothetical protein [Bacteroidaceae bacterium]
MATKNSGKGFVQCDTCKNAIHLVQCFENPIIAVCRDHPYQREVAATRRLCKLYRPARPEDMPPIKHFDSYEESDAFFKS